MCEGFLGITQGNLDNQISIGILNIPRCLILSRSFSLEREDFTIVTTMCSKDSYTSDLEEIQEFLAAGFPEKGKIQTLMEVPSAFLDRDAIHIKMLMFLARKGYCAFQFGFDESKQKIRLSLIPKEMRFATFGVHEVMYIQPNICKAYTEWLLEAHISSEEAALGAASIARDKNLYYFFTSISLVQSSQDILFFMKHPPKHGSSVITVDGVIGLTSCSLTIFENIEKIPLKYAVAAKRYAFLGQVDSLKMALLTVCKLWKIRLHYTSFYDEKVVEKRNEPIEETFGVDEEHIIYDPQRDVDLLPAVAH